MKPDPSLVERLLRLLDGRATTQERQSLESELRLHPNARAILRNLAEQAVSIADIERLASPPIAFPESNPRRPPSRPWRHGLAAAACIALALGVTLIRSASTDRSLGKVVKVTGNGSYFGSRGAANDNVQSGLHLHAGDALETRSCDSWIEIELRDGTHLTIAGQSTLRLLAPLPNALHLELPRGNLWSTPATNPTHTTLSVRTPSALLESHSAQFDLQTDSATTFIRVNHGFTHARNLLDGSDTVVPAGHQAFLTLTPGSDLLAVPQPTPVTSWAFNPGQIPWIILGRWLPPNASAQARLRAVPLLWPLPDRPPVTLHAVSLSVLQGNSQPVLLQNNSLIRFRGQVNNAQTVRFGFSTQRMRGVFAGKFEVDVPPDLLGPVGAPWQITLKAEDFRPLQPLLAAKPAGLELYDIYALTIHNDASLEIHQIEILPNPQPAPPQ